MPGILTYLRFGVGGRSIFGTSTQGFSNHSSIAHGSPVHQCSACFELINYESLLHFHSLVSSPRDHDDQVRMRLLQAQNLHGVSFFNLRNGNPGSLTCNVHADLNGSYSNQLGWTVSFWSLVFYDYWKAGSQYLQILR